MPYTDPEKRREYNREYHLRIKNGYVPKTLIPMTPEQRVEANRAKSKRYRDKKYRKDPDFYKKNNRKYAEQQKQWRKDNPLTQEQLERNRERSSDHYASSKGRAKSLCHNAATRAARRGIPFNLKWQDIQARIEAGHCEVTGIPFDLEPNEGVGPSPYAPSIDQIIPGVGYTPENSRVVVMIYNVCKGVWDDQTVREFSEAVIQSVPSLRLVGNE